MPATPTPEPQSPDQTFKLFTRKVLLVSLTVIVLFALYTVFKMAFQILLVFFAAVLFGIFLHGISSFIRRHTKLPYKWSLLLTCVLFFATSIGGLYALGPSLSSQAEQLRQSLPEVLTQLREKVSTLPYGDKLLGQVPEPTELLKGQNSILSKIFSFFSSTVSALANIVIILVIGIYLAASPQSTANGLVRLVPLPRRPRAREVLHVLRYTLWGWLKGTLLAVVVIGTITTIGLWIIGVPLPLLLGVFSGLLEFVPNIGPFIASVPAILLALVQSPTMALYVVLLFFVVQSIEGYLLTPLVQKKITDIPPVLTIMGQLLLGILAGFWGLLLAVPLVAVVMVLIKMLYIEDVLGDREIDVKGEEEAIAHEEHRQHHKNRGSDKT